MTNELQALAAEVSGALADLIETVRDGGSNLSEVSSTLVEMLDILKAAKPAETMQPVFNVPSSQVTVMPSPRIEHIEHEYDLKGRLVRSVPVYKGT
jgi:hypothetical protein